MKKNNFLPFAFLLVTVFPGTTENHTGKEKVSWHLSVPLGTKTEVNENHLTITMPERVVIWGLNKETQQYDQFQTASFTCACESRDGKCMPFVADTYVGCATYKDAACSRCVGTKSKATEMLFSEYSRVYYVHNLLPGEDDDIGPISPVYPVRSPLQIDKLEQVTEEVLNEPEVDEDLRTIIDGYEYDESLDFSDGKVPVGYSLVAILIKDYIGYIVIPSNQMETVMVEIPMFNFDGAEYASIRCSGCAGSCSLKTKFLGKVKFCDGCNIGCAIHY